MRYKIFGTRMQYRVGVDGSVWSRINNRWGVGREWRRLKQGRINSKAIGYYRFAVQIGGRGGRFRYVHQLVLENFVGPRPTGHEACHENGVPYDNRLSNLYWGTPQQNDADQSRHGKKKGERHHMATLTDAIVREIRARVAVGETQQSIADDLRIQRRNVGRVADRSRWGHVV